VFISMAVLSAFGVTGHIYGLVAVGFFCVHVLCELAATYLENAPLGEGSDHQRDHGPAEQGGGLLGQH
jgi:hypothetical protein